MHNIFMTKCFPKKHSCFQLVNILLYTCYYIWPYFMSDPVWSCNLQWKNIIATLSHRSALDLVPPGTRPAAYAMMILSAADIWNRHYKDKGGICAYVYIITVYSRWWLSCIPTCYLLQWVTSTLYSLFLPFVFAQNSLFSCSILLWYVSVFVMENVDFNDSHICFNACLPSLWECITVPFVTINYCDMPNSWHDMYDMWQEVIISNVYQ